MTTSASEFDLTDSMRALHRLARELAIETRKPWPDPSSQLGRLQALVANLGEAKPARPVRCPEEYQRQWHRFLEDKNQAVEPRAIRYLCWQSEIATSQRFQYYLDQTNVELERSSLQGLVRSCHAEWSPEFAKGQVVARIRDRVKTYKGPNRLLSLWRENLALILGPKGAEEFGTHLVKNLPRIEEHCELWGITDKTCAYVQAAVQYAIEICRERMDTDLEKRQYLLKELLLWRGWGGAPDAFKKEVSKVILRPVTTEVTDIRESVTRLVLNDSQLGDPRLEYNRLNWVGWVEAKDRVIEWLSEYGIRFFFESVLRPGKDPHGRKEFWLRYLPSIKRSRPLLSWIDRPRLETILKEKGRELAHCGSMDDRSTASVFLLDFGNLLAIEFSQIGNACYLYRKTDIDKVLPDFWSSKAFNVMQLKRKDLVYKHIVHRHGWQEKAAQILAQFDIRPGRRQWDG